ncbi:MAG: hypothetical protein MZV64_44300 [Ignavibacteriales bacterium]|nr:hypothetical protein [Ignavibacteriales bacterium]
MHVLPGEGAADAQLNSERLEIAFADPLVPARDRGDLPRHGDPLRVEGVDVAAGVHGQAGCHAHGLHAGYSAAAGRSIPARAPRLPAPGPPRAPPPPAARPTLPAQFPPAPAAGPRAPPAEPAAARSAGRPARRGRG